jgi:hypothetical protein
MHEKRLQHKQRSLQNTTENPLIASHPRFIKRVEDQVSWTSRVTTLAS